LRFKNYSLVLYQQTQTTMKNSNTYAQIIKTGKSFLIVDSANQCHFATTSKVKAENRLKSILKNAGF
jgi:hypothetical protein